MERWRSKAPILIALLVIAVSAFSLTTYKAPTYATPEEMQAKAKAQAASVPKLMQKASTANAVKQTASPKGSKSVAKVNESGDYADGVYYGSAAGFKSTIKVKVTIKDGKIARIEVVSSGDDPSYFNRAKALLGRIVLKQSTNVDTVSGATYSSAGLIKAVRNALAKAEKAKNKKSSKTKKKSKKKSTPAVKPGKQGQFPYPDGSYEGTAEGYSSDITVRVTIKDKSIKKIEVVSQDDDPEFFQRALAVLKNMVTAQSTKVDVVSGATYSSRGLINATINALKVAQAAAEKTDPTEPSKQIDPADPTKQTDPADPSNPTDPTDPTDATDPTDPTEPTYPYIDGTYSVSTMCYADEDEDFDDYTMSVDVTIKDGKISDISATGDGSSTNNSYIKRALNGMKKKLVGRDSASGVDTVSGATCSSDSIIDACTQALYQAKR